MKPLVALVMIAMNSWSAGRFLDDGLFVPAAFAALGALCFMAFVICHIQDLKHQHTLNVLKWQERAAQYREEVQPRHLWRP